jgi:PRD domain protein (TIGR03582 family)
MNRVINEVQSKISMTHQESVELSQFLEGIERELNKLNLGMSFNQWVAMSIHLVNLIRRVKEKETVPTIEPSLWEQLSQQIVESSRSLLEPIKDQLEDSHYSSEVFLLAVHLEGASHLQGGE